MTREIEDGVARLRQHPFLTVVGPSGSGKSSLVYAGLLPALKRSRHFGDGNLTVKSMRPGQTPFTALVQLLKLPDNSLPIVNRQSSIVNSSTLLVVDQFEEVFTLADETEATQFLTALYDLIGTSDLHILLTVRADFYPELMAMGSLWERVKANRLELTPLGDDDLLGCHRAARCRRRRHRRRSSGRGPDQGRHRRSGRAAPRSGDAGTALGAGRAPPTQTHRLHRHGRGQPQRHRRGHRPPRWCGLPQPARCGPAPARRIFLRLVQFGAGRADTRRQQTTAELRASADDPALFDETLRILTDNRLLTTSGSLDENGSDRRVDISHEALIGGWGLLQTSIREKPRGREHPTPPGGKGGRVGAAGAQWRSA